MTRVRILFFKYITLFTLETLTLTSTSEYLAIFVIFVNMIRKQPMKNNRHAAVHLQIFPCHSLFRFSFLLLFLSTILRYLSSNSTVCLVRTVSAGILLDIRVRLTICECNLRFSRYPTKCTSEGSSFSSRAIRYPFQSSLTFRSVPVKFYLNALSIIRISQDFVQSSTKEQ